MSFREFINEENIDLLENSTLDNVLEKKNFEIENLNFPSDTMINSISMREPARYGSNAFNYWEVAAYDSKGIHIGSAGQDTEDEYLPAPKNIEDFKKTAIDYKFVSWEELLTKSINSIKRKPKDVQVITYMSTGRDKNSTLNLTLELEVFSKSIDVEDRRTSRGTTYIISFGGVDSFGEDEFDAKLIKKNKILNFIKL